MNFEDCEIPKKLTKRIITGMAARVFDPQGYVAPVTIRAKLIIQELWRLDKKWDDLLPEGLQKEWIGFYTELSLINHIRIPRWMGMTISRKVQIHVFCDASSKAYGAVAYLRVWKESGWDASLLISK